MAFLSAKISFRLKIKVLMFWRSFNLFVHLSESKMKSHSLVSLKEKALGQQQIHELEK